MPAAGARWSSAPRETAGRVGFRIRPPIRARSRSALWDRAAGLLPTARSGRRSPLRRPAETSRKGKNPAYCSRRSRREAPPKRPTAGSRGPAWPPRTSPARRRSSCRSASRRRARSRVCCAAPRRIRLRAAASAMGRGSSTPPRQCARRHCGGDCGVLRSRSSAPGSRSAMPARWTRFARQRSPVRRSGRDSPSVRALWRCSPRPLASGSRSCRSSRCRRLPGRSGS